MHAYGRSSAPIAQGLVYDINAPHALGLRDSTPNAMHAYGRRSVPIAQGLVYDINTPHALGLRESKRGMVTFNFSLRNLTQVTSTMKPGQCMIWFFFGKENNSSRRVILKIELELNNLNSILSRSAVTPVFPCTYFIVCSCTCVFKSTMHLWLFSTCNV